MLLTGHRSVANHAAHERLVNVSRLTALSSGWPQTTCWFTCNRSPQAKGFCRALELRASRARS